MSANKGSSRRAGLPAAERRRREEQSASDRARGSSGSQEISEAERQRRLRQGRADREVAGYQDAIFNTVYGGDINMMSKGDW